jgi:hypothetical protein
MRRFDAHCDGPPRREGQGSLARFPKREEFFGPLGVTNIRTFVDPENPTRVGLVMDVADMDAVMAAMETQPAADAMAHDGVLPETLVILVEA